MAATRADRHVAGLPTAGALAEARGPRSSRWPVLGGARRHAVGAAVRRAALDEWRHGRGGAGGDCLGRYSVLSAGGLDGAPRDLGMVGGAAGTCGALRQPWPNRGTSQPMAAAGADCSHGWLFAAGALAAAS